MCLCLRVLCVSLGRERAKRPLPCTQIITWFYNVAYLYSGQFPLGPGSGVGGEGGVVGIIMLAILPLRAGGHFLP